MEVQLCSPFAMPLAVFVDFLLETFTQANEESVVGAGTHKSLQITAENCNARLGRCLDGFGIISEVNDKKRTVACSDVIKSSCKGFDAAWTEPERSMTLSTVHPV